MLEPSEEDAAFLTRLFGMYIPPDDTSFRPALERLAHVDMLKDAFPEENAWERCGKPMVNNLVGHCLWAGTGTQSLGWSIEEDGEFVVLTTLKMKFAMEKAA